MGSAAAPARRDPATDRQAAGRPCCDVFELADGKIKRFDCFTEGSVILTGVSGR
jgi:hypothetical protein